MSEYYTNTIESKLIKNLLSNTPLPICDTVREGDYILSPFIYINRCNIFKCTKSGRFSEDAEVQVLQLSLIHISEPTRHTCSSRMPSSA